MATILKWGKRRFGGQTYDLTHLDPTSFAVPNATPGLADYRVRVEYGAHVFTKTWTHDAASDHKMHDGGTPRCFCPVRYSHSLHLPAIVPLAASGRIFFSSQQRFVLVGNPPGVAYPYAIFFKLNTATNGDYDALMTVVSAHERPNLAHMKAKPFPWIIDYMRSGRPFIWPKKK